MSAENLRETVARIIAQRFCDPISAADAVLAVLAPPTVKQIAEWLEHRPCQGEFHDCDKSTGLMGWVCDTCEWEDPERELSPAGRDRWLLHHAQQIAALHPGPTLAEVRAGALEDAAEAWSDWDALAAPEQWLRERAAAERGQA